MGMSAAAVGSLLDTIRLRAGCYPHLHAGSYRNPQKAVSPWTQKKAESEAATASDVNKESTKP